MATPRFEITKDMSPVAFQTHITLNLEKPIEDQLHRTRLMFKTGSERGDMSYIRKIIDYNASLRVSFGWSFESEALLSDMMDDCMNELGHHFNSSMPKIVSDMRGDWIGFVPYNAFEKYDIDQLSLYGMIIFNNELVNYQLDVVKFIANHKSYLQHAIARDQAYRFNIMRAKRSSPDDLEEAFAYYIHALRDTTGLSSIPRRYVEETIGVHYLKHPDVFFELMDFYTLKGMVHE